jgi:gamma-glutamyltranspeptidase / glutathione hydrolase / leukotriene-C4 hydrolase
VFCDNPCKVKTAQLTDSFIKKLRRDIYTDKHLIKRPALGKVLEQIAKEGESAFYNGSLTPIIVDEIQKHGGIIKIDDLKNYKCIIKEPITHTLRNKCLVNSVPGPSCGVLFNFILAILDGFDYDETTIDSVGSMTRFCHQFTESSKFAFGLRYLIGDDNCSENASDAYKYLNTESIINEYRQKIIDDSILPIDVYGNGDFVSDNGTSHTSVIAPNGDAVSATSSINLM